MGGDLPVVSLRPMTEPEFESYVSHTIDEYADEVARNTGISIETARAQAQGTIAEELSDGVRSTGQRLLIAENAGGERIGHTWLAHKPDTNGLYIYDIEVEAPARGKGYGRRLMELIEDEARTMGLTRIELNVFADNEVARSLYASTGYREMRSQMVKQLD